MKEHGLLCTASVALALHEGRQTQDRRPMKAQPPKGLEKMFPYPKIHGNICLWCAEKDIDFPCWKYHSVCPVQVGDIFYVREAFSYAARDGYDAPQDDRPGIGDDYSVPFPIWYRASDQGQVDGPWCSAATMPRWASRTRKQVIGIRVEHGPEISEADAKAEGFRSWNVLDNDHGDDGETAKEQFLAFWHRQYGDDKPWRWVYDLGEIEG